jgi:hypothetical protein
MKSPDWKCRKRSWAILWTNPTNSTGKGWPRAGCRDSGGRFGQGREIFSELLETRFPAGVEVEDSDEKSIFDLLGIELITPTRPDGAMAKTLQHQGQGLKCRDAVKSAIVENKRYNYKEEYQWRNK